jgi:molybdate transport system permease protein
VTRRTKSFSLLAAVALTLLVGATAANHAYASSEYNTSEQDITISADASAAADAGQEFAIEGFMRMNVGTSRDYDGRDYGYRYPQAGPDAFVAVSAGDELLIHVPADAARVAGFDVTDKDAQQAFVAMLLALDDANANNGPLLRSTRWDGATFTTEDEYQLAGVTYRFAVEVEPGHYYTTLTTADGSPVANQSLCCDSGFIKASSLVAIADAPDAMEQLMGFFSSMDYRPFWVSLRTSAVAMVFVFVLGLAFAQVSMRLGPRLKGVLDSILTIPMVLPPTVCGFLLLVLFGNSTALGRWLNDHGIELVFTWPAAVIAAIVVSFPLMYRTARGAFEAQDAAMFDAARTLGWSNLRIFLKLQLPLAWPSIAAGTVLAFARAMGEFGATLFVAGNYAGVTQTMPIAIYFQWMGGHSDVAVFWVVVVILISFIVILFINWYGNRTQRYRR